MLLLGNVFWEIMGVFKFCLISNHGCGYVMKCLTNVCLHCDSKIMDWQGWWNKKNFYLPVWMYVCFFMSLFWWKRFPQYEHGYGLVSLCISKWVDSVLDRLNALPHCLHSNTFSTLWIALRIIIYDYHFLKFKKKIESITYADLD